MGNSGLPKLLGAGFTRIQPALCGYCQHYRDPDDRSWAEYCAAKGKVLVNAHTLTGRCKQFERAEVQPVPDATIAEWRAEAQKMQDWKRDRPKPWWQLIADDLKQNEPST